MILSALLAVASIASPVEDYFPLVPGTRWTYEDGNGLQMTEEVGQPIDAPKKIKLTPVVTSSGGRTFGSNLYGLDGDTMKLYGTISGSSKSDPNLLKEPQPILRIAS